MERLGEAWTPNEAAGWVGKALTGVEWVHVASLSRSDFPAETLAVLGRGRRLSLDGQGLVRPPRTGPLHLDGEYDPEVLGRVSLLKLAEDEAALLLDDLTEDSLRSLGVPEVVVTLGSRGSLVFASGRLEHVSARAIPSDVDPTGAGDAFITGYVSARSAGQAPAPAAHWASGLVADLLTGRLR